jgi:phenylpropionate dioxygenase-like ring-hydroxylating dioxygenase large terminal subunit
MNKLVDHQYATRYTNLGRGPISVEPSRSAQWFEEEREAIFKRCWLNIGRVDDVPAPGDYYVRTVDVWNTSVLIIHGRDGRIRAFHNVCTHRGNLVANDGKGSCRGFVTCPFHGWVFDDTGRLREVTDETNFFDLDRPGLGLREIPTELWNGFVFSNLNPQQSLGEYLGALTSRKINSYPFNKLTARFTYQAHEKVNWKVLLDAQQEGYHVPYIHKRTLSLSFPESLTRFRSLLMDIMGPHRLLATGPSAEPFSPTPTGAVAMKHGPNSIEAFAGGGSAADYVAAMEGVFDFHVIFPNFVVAVLYGTYFTYNMWPIAADQTLWEVNMFYPKPTTAGELFAAEYGKVCLRDGLLEDASTHERTQRGINSGAITNFQFQDEEAACRHGHEQVVAWVQRWSASQ